MSQPYIGEIRLFGGNFAPYGWMFCDGATLQISEYDTLFNLLGTTYGGDGQDTFCLPDLRGRVPLHTSNNNQIGTMAGAEAVTLSSQQIPSHAHAFVAANAQGTDNSPSGRVPAVSQNVKRYINDTPDGAMHGQSINGTGGSQPHDNFQPYLCVSYIIAVFGLWPSQT